MCTLEDCLASPGVKHIWRDHFLHVPCCCLQLIPFVARSSAWRSNPVFHKLFLVFSSLLSHDILSQKVLEQKLLQTPRVAAGIPTPEAGRLPG